MILAVMQKVLEHSRVGGVIINNQILQRNSDQSAGFLSYIDRLNSSFILDFTMLISPDG